MDIQVNGKDLKSMATFELASSLPPSEGGMNLLKALITVRDLLIDMEREG
jgi:hypothetical protein